jgi:hypothetical protein
MLTWSLSGGCLRRKKSAKLDRQASRRIKL